MVAEFNRFGIIATPLGASSTSIAAVGLYVAAQPNWVLRLSHSFKIRLTAHRAYLPPGAKWRSTQWPPPCRSPINEHFCSPAGHMSLG